MTNQESIEKLQAIKFLLDKEIYSDEVEGALDMAIKALEQQPKTGHWKEHDTTFGRNIYYCTACGRSIEILYKYDFCPLCGAHMEVEE